MNRSLPPRVYLSPPHLGSEESRFVREAFDDNWIAPVGPHIDAFEEEFAGEVGARHAVAVSSGTAALHLALILLGIRPGDEVIVSDLTFVASVNPILYEGATPILIDSERDSWNMDPAHLRRALEDRARNAALPSAVVLVHLYGQSANIEAIGSLCEEFGVPLIEDAAEALGATYGRRSPGTFGRIGIFSFNGNKIITTSGGGMLVTEDADLAARARKLSTQARDPAPHYQHSEVGYNYRMSNVLAGIGRGQLKVLADRVQARRAVFDRYRTALGGMPGLEFMPEAPWGRCTRWLTVMVVDPEEFGTDREALRLALESENIEARPVWKPMHLQPIMQAYEIWGGEVGEELFERGLCLPSGSSLTADEQDRVVGVIRSLGPGV